MRRLSIAIALLLALASSGLAADLERVRVADDGRTFVLDPSGKTFVPWGVNYDHDRSGRLIEDYWDEEWQAIADDFREIKQLGANVVRIHLQFARFMEAPDKPNGHSLAQLERLLNLAEETGLYLDLTGLGCYHKKDVPPWYDELDEPERWQAQANFWEAVAQRCAASSAIFCYDLMNEPTVGNNQKRGDWLAPPFAGKHFVQFISLNANGRERSAIARQWTSQLAAAVRKRDPRHLVTVGLVPWSLDRPGLTSGFIPDRIAGDLDFIAVHLYPESGKIEEAIETLKGFAEVQKPVVIEEIFPLRCSAAELSSFIDESKQHATGWIGFYWGQTADEYRQSSTQTAGTILKWLELFEEKGKQIGR
jgi:hypothetical protein